MAKLSILAGTTSKLIDVFIQDSSVTTGAGLTGLTNGSSGLTWYYYREGAASATQVSAIASMTLGTWVTKGFIVVDGTNMPGCYQLGVPDAAIAAGAKSVIMLLKGVTNMAPLVLEIELTATDNQAATNGGLTNLDATISSRMATYTQPTGFLAATFPSGTIANTTNITAGTIATVTTLTNLPAIPANWLTAAGIAASALNGKGDWLLSASYTAPTNLTAAQIATGIWQDTTAGDFTTALSVGKSVMNGVALGTGLTVAAVSGAVGSVTGAVASVTGNVGGNVVGSVASVTAGVTVTTNNDKTGYSLTQTFPSNFSSLGITAGGHISNVDTLTTYTGNTVQTGDAFARVGAAGAGLTALGDTRIANLDATVTSRMATYSQPTGFLAATFPATVASPTNITAGTITTTTNLTNLPSIPTNWLTATGITAGALDGKGDWLLASNYTAPTNLSAAEVWDEALSGHTAPGSTGAALSAAGAGGDPWTTLLPGAYSAGQAGKIVGDNINATISSRSTFAGGAVASVTGSVGGNVVGSVGSVTGLTASNLDATVSSRSTFAGGAVASVTGSVGSVVGLTVANLDVAVSSRLATSSYTAPDNTDIAAIKVQTDKLTFTIANVLNANVRYVNDIAVTGAGTTGSPWGP